MSACPHICGWPVRTEPHENLARVPVFESLSESVDDQCEGVTASEADRYGAGPAEGEGLR